MKKMIKLDLEVYSKLLTKKNEFIVEQDGKTISFSQTIGRLLQNDI